MSILIPLLSGCEDKKEDEPIIDFRIKYMGDWLFQFHDRAIYTFPGYREDTSSYKYYGKIRKGEKPDEIILNYGGLDSNTFQLNENGLITPLEYSSNSPCSYSGGFTGDNSFHVSFYCRSIMQFWESFTELYGNKVNSIIPVRPTLSTIPASEITCTSSVCGGNITSDGGSPVIDRGVCWDIIENPTINDNKTSDGTGTGIFTSMITGLDCNTTYYVRAYATNSEGTAYGNQVSFISEMILVNTFGPDYSYLGGSGWTLGYDNNTHTSWVQAIGFVPRISGSILQYKIAVSRINGGVTLNAWLLSDNNSYPGSLIEQFIFIFPSETNNCKRKLQVQSFR